MSSYQLLDGASRYDVGTDAYSRHENSTDAKDLLERAIAACGAPKEVLSDNSLAFNQLRAGTIGSVEIFLVSKGCHADQRAAGDLLEHTPATEPIPLSVLEAKASEYRRARASPVRPSPGVVDDLQDRAGYPRRQRAATN